MTQQDRQDRYSREARNEAGNQRGDVSRQPQQWQQPSSQQGGWDRDSGQNTGFHDYGAARDREATPGGYTTENHEQSGYYAGGRQQAEHRGSGGISYGSYDRHSYEAPGDRFRSFSSEDYGGRDFATRGSPIPGGLSPSNSYQPSYGLSSWSNNRQDSGTSSREFDDWRNYGERRGFLSRAGDEIASWFGDADAARRREQDHAEDHRGSGPANYTRSDERIREDANDALTRNPWVNARDISVSVAGGEVTLDGHVDNRAAKRRAEDAVDEISGVRHVQNNLRVRDDASHKDRSALGSSVSAGTAGKSG
ncbi:BON domain-containing protein [Novosphingobium colocasiae]|uniref:BON domain-containing protein n=1 Tax=Novosphingobium colocasiae TaxID=1256513 RepID=UPI0035B3EE4A